MGKSSAGRSDFTWAVEFTRAGHRCRASPSLRALADGPQDDVAVVTELLVGKVETRVEDRREVVGNAVDGLGVAAEIGIGFEDLGTAAHARAHPLACAAPVQRMCVAVPS